MKRRCLSILLILALILSVTPVPVHAVGETFYVDTYIDAPNNIYNTFDAAVAAAGSEDYIVLNTDTDIGAFSGGSDINSYSIDLNGHTLTGTSFTSPATWEIYDRSTGTNRGTFDVDTITIGSVGLATSISARADEGTFSFRSGTRIELVGDSMLWVGNGGEVSIESIESTGDDAWVKFAEDGATGTVGTIELTGTGNMQILIANSTLEIGQIRVENSNSPSMSITGSTVQCDNLFWLSNNPIEMTSSVLTIGLADMGSETEANDAFQIDNDSKVEILMGGGNGVQGSYSLDWFTAYLDSHTPNHIHVDNDGAVINVTQDANIDSSPRGPLEKIVLKDSFETAVYSNPTPTFQTKQYTGQPQALFPEADPVGGTVYYTIDGASFTTVAPSDTTVGNYPNAAYQVMGDIEHNDSALTAVTVGIVPAPLTITANSDTVTYNGESQMLEGFEVTAGTLPENFWIDAEATATGTAAGEYPNNFASAPIIRDGGDNDVTANFDITPIAGALTIEKSPVTVKANDFIIRVGQAAPDLSAPVLDTHYTVTGLIAPDTLTGTAIMEYIGGDPDTSTAGTVEIIITGLDVPNTNYELLQPFETGTLTIQASSGSTPKQESYDFTQPEEGVGSGVVDDEAWTWGERANLPTDTATLYMILSNNAVSEDEENPLPFPEVGTEHFLADEDVWVLPEENPPVEEDYKIETVMVCQDNEPLYFANGDGKVDESTFGNSDFFAVGVGTGDTKIDYPNLKTGDVVTNKTFNGVFVTKLQKSNNPTFDADLAKLKSDTIASFRAFELDHPEVFWLNGSIKLRVLTVTIGGEQTSFIFMTLVDDGGFTMRIAEYSEKGAIERGIAQRDAAVAAIIAQIPAGASTREKIANLNKWFTMNNEYNRSADLSSIGYTPHRSLKSLTGNFGINGPVCDGYSRGFKTVCDRLGIPVVLETGVASIGTHSELHMWMSIKVDGTWYGTDCTWNDPIVKGKDGKVSGYENEKYLLVGNDTVVDGAKFGVSHPANKTPGGTTGVLFASLILNTNEIDGYTPLDYEDVRTGDWFYDYVQNVSRLGLMNGTSPSVFSPQGTATRGQIVQILYNIAGQPEIDEVTVDGWFGTPATWAMNKGIVAGYADGDFHGNDPVTREQLATIIWAFEGAPAQEGTLRFADADKVSEYAVQALLWAKKEGIIGGKPGNLVDPQGTATRAEIATIFSNYMK